MNKKYHFVLGALILIFLAISINLCYFWRLNQSSKNLEDSFLRLDQNQKILSAYLLNIQELKPIRKVEENLPEITASSAISLLIKNDGSERILYEKNKEKILPIASLTKLMTAKIVLENYNLNKIIKIRKESVEQIGKVGNYKIGESFKVKDLLYSILIESSNHAAQALAQVIGIDNFVNLMNFEAKKMGLLETSFVNPTGLPLTPHLLQIKGAGSTTSTPILLGENYSTAADLAEFGKSLVKNNSKILEISSLIEFDLCTADGFLHHKVENKILKENQNLEVLASKTGYTIKAKKCLFLIIKAPKNQGVIINVILSSKSYFEEMRKLIDWLETAYRW